MLLTVALLATFVQACGAKVAEAPIQGTVPVVHEVERNDASHEANDLGWIKPGDALELRGAIGPAAWDPYDGFTLRAWSDLKLVVELATFDAAVVDLHVHDPLLEETIASFGCDCGALRVDLDVPAGAVFQLVVGAWHGASDWRLRIAAAPGAWVQPPTGARVAAGAHAVDVERARGYGAAGDDDGDRDEPCAPRLPAIGAVAIRGGDGRLELFEVRLHPSGVLLEPIRGAPPRR